MTSRRGPKAAIFVLVQRATARTYQMDRFSRRSARENHQPRPAATFATRASGERSPSSRGLARYEQVLVDLPRLIATVALIVQPFHWTHAQRALLEQRLLEEGG